MTIGKLLAASAIALISTAAAAKTQSGSANGVNWTATSTIVGQTSSGTVATGGDPKWLALNTAGYSGVAGMLMTYDDGSAFVCSGTLTGDTTFVTAGHCVSNGGGTVAKGLVRTQIVFVNDAASLADTSVYAGVFAGTPAPGVTAIDASYIKVNANYTGEVIDQNDIAMIRLSQAAPAYAQRYGVYYGGDLTGVDFNVAGWGTRSVTGGNDGYTGAGAGAGTGRRRQGDNRYDFAWGDSDFGGFYLSPDANEPGCGPNWFCGSADITYSYVSDFDNGNSANDTACLTVAAFNGLSGSKFCDTGRGATEASIAGGDSGGPGFVNGQLASVNSYGLTFGSAYGDIKCTAGPGNCLQSSFGEFNGYVPTFIHQNFIEGFNGVPEPSQWALMLGGFGMLGGAMRRRKTKASVTFA